MKKGLESMLRIREKAIAEDIEGKARYLTEDIPLHGFRECAGFDGKGLDHSQLKYAFSKGLLKIDTGNYSYKHGRKSYFVLIRYMGKTVYSSRDDRIDEYSPGRWQLLLQRYFDRKNDKDIKDAGKSMRNTGILSY